MATWRERFEKLGAEISNHPLLIVDRLEVGDPASEDDIEAAKSAAGGALPKGMQEIYSEMNGFRLDWQARDEDRFEGQKPHGRIRLLMIGTDVDMIFASWNNEIWSPKDGDERFKAVKPVDYFLAESCAALYPVPGDMMMHYHDLGEELHPTGYSFLEYLDLLLKSRGYLYWQHLLCADNQETPEAQEFRANMPRLFPDYDESVFRPNTTQHEMALKVRS
jgi:hypothetical protein